VIDWKRRARELADHLVDVGEVHTPVWREVFAAVPRHEFVPSFYEQREPGQWERVDGVDQRDRWLDAVYSNATLVTAVTDIDMASDIGPFGFAVSSSTVPGLMAQMLEDLDLDDRHTVLEIGTGTGYNAALLSERVGDQRVFSVDLRPDLVEAAAARLAGVGHHPTLATADGADGLALHAPYDRIIATCAVTRIPAAWIEQLRPGGIMLVDVRGAMSAGNIAKLHRRDGDVVEGRLWTEYGGFMEMQHALAVHPGRSYPSDVTDTTERTTTAGPEAVDGRDGPLAFFAQLHLPAGTQLRRTGEGDDLVTRLIAPDGSWCDVSHRSDHARRYRAVEGGPQRLWRTVEGALERYMALGRPAWQRFGITASATHQSIWLDSPGSGLTWPIVESSFP
jgi:methyltransferase of ATP-grasp peptide maturase system